MRGQGIVIGWQNVPIGWPVSLGLLAATAILYLLQRFQFTGIFLMFVGAAFWSVVLINLAMAGIVLEAASGKVGWQWLALPALYFGGYYCAYFNDQRTLGKVAAETVRFNDGKSLPFDPAERDLVLEDPKDGLGIRPSEFIERFGLPRIFDGNGRVHLIGTPETCTLARTNRAARAAGVETRALKRASGSAATAAERGCTIVMPGEPDKPAVRIVEAGSRKTANGLPLWIRDYSVTDESTEQRVAVRTARAGPLKPFPMPVLGCALNSSAPSWDCFHEFMRDTAELPLGRPRHAGAASLIASVLGLEFSGDTTAHAVGPEEFQAMADRADADLAAKELALLAEMLARPLAPRKDSWFRQLIDRPDLVAPYAGRLFEALGVLQTAGQRGYSDGRQLWRLVAVLPETALLPHRRQMIEWMQPGAVQQWTAETLPLYHRLDVSNLAERDIVLARLEQSKAELPASLLTAFCRMGTGAPPDAQARLLAIWRARGERARERRGERTDGEEMLYLVLARMGLKEQAGRVEQRHMGPTFAAIWDHVTPDSPDAICELTAADLRARLKGM